MLLLAQPEVTSMQQVLSERLLPRSRSSWLAETALIVGATLFIAAFAQLSIPLQPVPITGQTFAVLLVGMALGSRRGALAVAAYLAAGAAGLPVFAEAKSGIATLLGPTGGYLVGFVAAAWVVGYLAERGWDRNLLRTFAAMVAGNVVIYAFGLAWLLSYFGGDLNATLAAGVYPFLLGDAIKAAAAALLLPASWKLLGSK
jgi:biotin transport system substrate-specific component